jgi:hypothetical protein
MDVFKRKLTAIFPSHSDEDNLKVCNAVQGLGVEDVHDLKLLKEDDLVEFMPPIKARRLIASFTEENVSTDRVPLPQLSLNQSSKEEQVNAALVSPAANWADDFQVPWHKLSEKFISDLENKQRPSESDVRQMVNVVMHDVLGFTRKPTRYELTIIARKVVSK